MVTRTYTSGPLAPYSIDIIGGDSGSAAFVWDGEELLMSGSNYGAGDELALHEFTSTNINSINAVMTSLGGGYQVAVKDISSFPTF
jgi:hypothetical protein